MTMRPTPETSLERRGRSVVMTLTYDSEIAAKRASDAMGSSLAASGNVVTARATKSPTNLSRKNKIFGVPFLAGNLAAVASIVMAPPNAFALVFALALLAVDGFMLFAVLA